MGKIASYDGAFKLKSDVEKATANNEDINDFNKFPVYRALKYNKKKKGQTQKLCAHLDFIDIIPNGAWIVEMPKMVNGKIQYYDYNDSVFNNEFVKYNASGILGCGEGSERFKTLHDNI